MPEHKPNLRRPDRVEFHYRPHTRQWMVLWTYRQQWHSVACEFQQGADLPFGELYDWAHRELQRRGYALPQFVGFKVL